MSNAAARKRMAHSSGVSKVFALSSFMRKESVELIRSLRKAAMACEAASMLERQSQCAPCAPVAAPPPLHQGAGSRAAGDDAAAVDITEEPPSLPETDEYRLVVENTFLSLKTKRPSLRRSRSSPAR